MGILKRAAAILSVPLLFAITGCDRTAPPMDPQRTPAAKMLMPIEGVDELGLDKDYTRLAHMFASGSEPPQKALAHYSDFRYEGKNPSQSGETATAVVNIKEAKTGQVRGDFKWTMKRENDVWKLTDAPLPSN
jgi:hypothetical protein